MIPSKLLLRLAALAAFAAPTFAAPALASAAEVKIAVAANFTEPAKEIAADYELKTGDTVVLSFGSSGQFYTEISQGAPFEVFLSADSARPKKAITAGLAVKGTEFTYAIGKLVLWSRDPGVVKGEATLEAGDYDKLSICDPAAAPYGKAAVETLKSLKLYDGVKPKLVIGANITQAYQFVATGNAPLGFVALSQVVDDKKGSRWLVPQTLYSPILQGAVLLKPGAGDPAAAGFLAFLKSPEARKIIAKYGYTLQDSAPAT